MLQNATALAPLFAHLLRQTQKLQAAGCPGAAGIFSFPYSQLLAFSPTSLVFLSKGRGLASAPWLWRELLANLRVPAVSHLQTSFI